MKAYLADQLIESLQIIKGRSKIVLYVHNKTCRYIYIFFIFMGYSHTNNEISMFNECKQFDHMEIVFVQEYVSNASC